MLAATFLAAVDFEGIGLSELNIPPYTTTGFGPKGFSKSRFMFPSILNVRM